MFDMPMPTGREAKKIQPSHPDVLVTPLWCLIVLECWLVFEIQIHFPNCTFLTSQITVLPNDQSMNDS